VQVLETSYGGSQQWNLNGQLLEMKHHTGGLLEMFVFGAMLVRVLSSLPSHSAERAF
jgi:hypothetical protein